MNHVLMTLALALVLAACGTSTPTVAQADQQIRAYADTIKAGDLTAARRLIANPSMDWAHTTERLIAKTPTSYTLRDVAQTPLGHEATIVWQSQTGKYPFCSYVRVRTDDGTLEMVKATTHVCPEAFEDLATP